MMHEIEIPEGADVKEENGNLKISGSKGELSRRFSNPFVEVKIENGKITLSSKNERKKVRAVMGTWKAVINNMILGVTKGWNGEVKMVYSHFPVKMKSDQGKLVIENFLGQKNPRYVSIPEDLKVDIDKSTIRVSGTDKERVGQLCARIEHSTKIKGYDKRVFQDGCYIVRKPYTEDENEGKD